MGQKKIGQKISDEKWTTNQIKCRTENWTKETRQNWTKKSDENRTRQNWTKKSDIRLRKSDIGHQTSDTGHKISEICYFVHLTLDIRYWREDIRHPTVGQEFRQKIGQEII